jgi:hypothetical protein
MTRVGESVICADRRRGSAIRSISSRAASAPNCTPAWSTLVNETCLKAAKSVLSYPTTEMSWGTESPASATASSAPIAAMSAPAKIAVGRVERLSSSRAPVYPPSRVYMVETTSIPPASPRRRIARR